MTASAELGLPALTVSPGSEATTDLTVRNETDIVEAYTFEVVGDCAAWTTVEPARISLYPGTSRTVTVRLAPPRSPDVRAGEVPLGIKVLPAEHPDLVSVPETTVTVTPFRELRAELAPRRRRGWLRARYRTSVRNAGNAEAGITLVPGQAGEELRFAFQPAAPRLAPGESVDVRTKVRTGKPIWFGKPVTWPFRITVGHGGGPEDGEAERTGQEEVLEGEFLQLSIFPKWLLALLAAIIALLLAWFALVRPAVQSSAKQAAAEAVGKKAAALGLDGTGQHTGAAGGASGQGTPGTGAQPAPGGGTGGTGGGPGGTGPGLAEPGTGRQSSTTIDVRTGGGGANVGVYRVPAGKVFAITDIVAANFQGDQGLLTIKFGDQTITTIALETFRNQDYHWVTPIEVPEKQTVSASVTCQKPGTPASGEQASECHELLNVSGELSTLRR
ncbi:COG1470 family protein [Streptantibioticus cattleyicolor]|uniref:Hydrolytic protein n=1 Tax=Streptantibioticus cattleyicolor (strain ATCC 35852 / DSM 46488 / JCM 4925 / NBRC 14057 / NRRL 8057) TaxID=1003195 RepID=F8JLE4_STREN|nr:hypothetical protein [Streptantibioticus cattleyicolor]AEW99561.1 hypothetical protein SCATT_p13680 [Streptantibioticus cattleyicolor NRRL 8057 = DSM 46488]CCB71400.1 conserved protein of unknown function [Streptantibioticus cattleyicolor NRRL 8057 = DSM 46488]